ncbi:DUF2637 domain-containing protein [Kitasatospora viridis]|uniref:Uncharacterized protein DUF2637 n=1 Tax=Kitasatospora viridis TaxID=281105 RepID=A0A561UDW8_9ACTN|nr:DUF2637 domain-containing protein [Kitasatospora viridis]TWF97525.1 uncharacterized protein DUF2637 [Kitasatospora viridis]
MAAPAAVSTPPATASETRKAASTTPADSAAKLMLALTILAAVGGTVLAGIGFTGSYSALAALGFKHGFGRFSYVFPVGVDAGIVALLAMDLHLIRRGTPWPLLRVLAHGFTVATIYFNAASAGPLLADPTGTAMHAVIPVMFIASVEAGRRLVVRITRIEAGRQSDGVPLHRWLLAPNRSWRMYRRMRLNGIPSYARAVELERDLLVYGVLLERDHGNIESAPADLRLPLAMARFGLSVDEALALPMQAEQAARLRDECREEFEAGVLARAEGRAAAAAISQLRTAGTVEAARHEVGADTAAAQAFAQARTLAAGREAAAAERLGHAEEELKAAAAEQEAADARKQAAETDQAAAETEKAAAETRRAVAETERQSAAEEKAKAQDEEDIQAARLSAAEMAKRSAETEEATAEARKRTAEADRDAAIARGDQATADEAAAQSLARATEARERAAEAERRAVEAEDEAKLTPAARATRRVARMILAQGGSPEAVSLQTIADLLDVSIATASGRRTEAAELLAAGYRATHSQLTVAHTA